MRQISNSIYCDNFLFDLDIKTRFLPSQYNELPFLVIDNFLSHDTCMEINRSIKQDEDYEKAMLLPSNNLNNSFLNEKIRKTNIYELDDIYKKIYEHNFQLFQRQIEGFFNMGIIKSTKIQVLEYLPGSFYSMHSDDSSMLFDNGKLAGFVPASHERKLTTVLFTTDYDEDLETEDSFYGGELLFNFLYDKNGNTVEIKPSAGQLIVFPSNPFFTHEVKKVISGRRISLVQWHNTILD